MTTATPTRRPIEPNKLIDLIPAAAYIRMSTDRQEDSPERQRRQIEDYATRNGYNVVRWYADHGMTGTESKKRFEYQRLIADAATGAFTAVLISEMSRLSREDLFSVIPQWGAFKEAGVTLVSCQRGVIDFGSMGGFLTAFIDQYSSHDESRKIADRSVSGKLNRILNGTRVDGNRLFGFDRNIVDATGAVLKRVSFRDKFIKPKDCKSVLVPSLEVKSVEAIKWAFDHIINGGSLNSIVVEFSKRKIVGWKGAKFKLRQVQSMLLNPSYAGHSVSGVRRKGKFHYVSDQKGILRIENSHTPIVDNETFNTVSEILKTRSQSRERWRQYLLSGLCVCGHCGSRLVGQSIKSGDYRYVCHHENRGVSCDVKPSFHGPRLERAVIQAWCDVFLVDETVSQMKLKPVADHSEKDRNELQSLAEQVARAERNLAIAETADDFQSVSKMLKAMRARESELRNKITRENRKMADIAPEIATAIASFKEHRGILADWPTLTNNDELESLARDLKVVLKTTIASVAIMNKRSDFGDDRVVVRRSATVTFNPDHVTAEDAQLTDEMLASPSRRRFTELANCVRQLGRPVRFSELVRLYGKSKSIALRHLRMCSAFGMVRKSETGWEAVSD